jgi:hypothetical protein
VIVKRANPPISPGFDEGLVTRGSDDSLLAMLKRPEDFRPEAIDAARQELTRRGVSIPVIDAGRIRRQNNEELLSMLQRPGRYHTEELEAARQELSLRGVDIRSAARGSLLREWVLPTAVVSIVGFSLLALRFGLREHWREGIVIGAVFVLIMVFVAMQDRNEERRS